MKSRALAVMILAGICAGCATKLTPQNVGPAFASYARQTADVNSDGFVSETEWVTSGGTAEGFVAIDKDRNGLLTIGEIKTASGTERFLAFAKSKIDTGGDSELTPRDFRSPAGAKLFSFPF